MGKELLEKRLPARYMAFAFLCFGAFISYAMFFNSIGANATVMMEYYAIDAAAQGMIMTLLAVGGIGVSLFLAFFGERFNKINVITAGVLLICAAAVFTGAIPALGAAGKSYALLLFLAMIAGVGCNMVDVMMNGMIKEVYPESRSGFMLSMTHASYGAMTMLAPLIVTVVVVPSITSSFTRPFVILSVIAAGVFLGLFFTGRRITKETVYADMTVMRGRARENPAEVFKTKKAWVFMAACILYFAFQVGAAMWLPTFYQTEGGFDYAAAGRMSTLFFGGALVMRFIFPLLLKKMSARRYYILFSAASGIAFLFALFIGGNAAFVLLPVSGFLQGASVVALIMMCCDAFPERTASASALASISVNISTIVFPPLMGRIAEASSFKIAFVMTALCLIASAVIIAAVKKEKTAV